MAWWWTVVCRQAISWISVDQDMWRISRPKWLNNPQVLLPLGTRNWGNKISSTWKIRFPYICQGVKNGFPVDITREIIIVDLSYSVLFHLFINSLVQDCSNSSALAMELLQSCTKPSTWGMAVMSLLFSILYDSRERYILFIKFINLQAKVLLQNVVVFRC